MLPRCSAAPPIICTSKCRWPSVRLAASRTVAKASGSRSSRDSPSAYRCLYWSVSARNSASLSAMKSSSIELIWSAIRRSLRRILPSPARRTLSMMAGTSRRAPCGLSGLRWQSRGTGHAHTTALEVIVGDRHGKRCSHKGGFPAKDASYDGGVGVCSADAHRHNGWHDQHERESRHG